MVSPDCLVICPCCSLDVEGGREYRHPDPNRPPKHMIQPDEVVSALEVERAKNIEVVECDNPESPHRFIVIASPYNDRHAQALTETVRRYFCRNYHFGVGIIARFISFYFRRPTQSREWKPVVGLFWIFTMAFSIS